LYNLSENKKEVIKREIKNLFHSLSFLNEIIDKDNEENNEDIFFTLFKNIENSIISLEDILELDLNLKKEHQDRILQLRNANIKIRDLENKIKELSRNQISPDYVSDVISDIQEVLKKKFKSFGLDGLIRFNIKTPYQVEISYLPMYYQPSTTYSKTPINDKENYKKYIKNLENEGFSFNENDLLLNEKNIELVENKIEKILNNVRFLEIKNYNDRDLSIIKEFKLNISLEDLINSLKY